MEHRGAHRHLRGVSPARLCHMEAAGEQDQALLQGGRRSPSGLDAGPACRRAHGFLLSVTRQVPLLPFIPVVSMFVNVYLMMQLDRGTWVRFAIWMVLGERPSLARLPGLCYSGALTSARPPRVRHLLRLWRSPQRRGGRRPQVLGDGDDGLQPRRQVGARVAREGGLPELRHRGQGRRGQELVGGGEGVARTWRAALTPARLAPP